MYPFISGEYNDITFRLESFSMNEENYTHLAYGVYAVKGQELPYPEQEGYVNLLQVELFCEIIFTTVHLVISDSLARKKPLWLKTTPPTNKCL